MVTPEKLEEYSYNRVVDIYNQLSVDICSDIIDRVSALGNITQTTRDELNVLLEINGQEIFEETLRRTTMLDDSTRQELKKLYEEVAKENMKGYKPLYDYRDEEFQLTNKQIKLINSKINENTKEIRNFTNSVAFNSKELFIESVDEAYLKASSGAFSYDKAIEQSYKKIASTGLKMTDKAGRKVAIDVAVRRCVLTGLQRMVNGINYSIGEQLGCDGYEVSAHIGARPTHEICQGLQYAIDKDTAKEYDIDWWYDDSQVGKPVAELWEEPNCRHTVFPIIVGINEPTYTKEELEEINNATTTLYGKEVPIYEANQEMRRLEREIRNTKREVDTLKQSNIEHSKENARLRRLQQEYTKVSNETNIPKYYDRIRTYSDNKISYDLTAGSSNYSKFVGFKKTKVDFIGHVDLNNSKELNAKINELRKNILDKPIENAYLIDKFGDIFHTTGTSVSVKFPNWVDYEDGIFIHNHPKDETYYSFSSLDVDLFVRGKLKEIYGDDYKYGYSIERKDKIKLNDYYEIRRKWNEKNKDLLELSMNDKIDIDLDGYDYINKKLAKEYDYKYERRTRKN